MGTDPFEEFEFKPLTEGLGFHQKKPTASTAQNFPESMASSPASSKMGLKTGLDLDFTSDEELNPFKKTLPRKSTPSPVTPAIAPIPSPVDEILLSLKKNRQLEIEEDKKQLRELKNSQAVINWQASGFSVWAAILDGLLVTASALMCMMIVLVVTQVDLFSNLSNPDTEGLIYLATLSLFAGVSFVYMVITRVFMGMTPGEWAYDLRIGKPQEQGSVLFTFQIVLRQILVTLTGFILLPLISLLMGKDVTGKILGLSLHRKS